MAVGRQAAQAATPARQRISVTRENFVTGGICPEGDYEVMSSKFTIFQYATKDGKTTGVITCAHEVKLQPLDAQGKAEGAEIEQMYSVGDVNKYAPSDDGNFLESVGTSTTLSSNSNYYIEWDALVNSGMPEDLFDTAGAVGLVGMRGHIAHIPAPDRGGLRSASAVGAVGTQQQPKRDLPKTIPVFKSIMSAPWDKGGKKGVVRPIAPAKQEVAQEPEAAEGGEGNDRVAGLIKDVLKANKGKYPRTKVRLEVFKKYGANKVDSTERDAEMAIFQDDGQLPDVLATFDSVIDGDNLVIIP